MSADFLATLVRARAEYALPPQLRSLAERLAREVMALLFPHYGGDAPGCALDDVKMDLARVRQTLRRAVGPLDRQSAEADADLVEAFVRELPRMREALLDDAAALLEGDPAARTLDEVIAAYPGFHAIALHRVAHALHGLGVPLLPRLLSEIAHRETGIDIHPGARIGHSFSIDHGTGVVIGETAEIGDRVKLYQGVTLGAASVTKSLARMKRHPTIGDDVVIYANATILGGDTVIGAASVIGGNVWLTRSVPPGSVVTHRSEVAHREAYDGVEDWSI